MSQDPNSAYGNNPQNPYGAQQPPYGQPQPGYGAQQPPYGQPPQNPYGQPQPGYGAQQPPYGQPPSGYEASQNPYGQPPTVYSAPQDPYSGQQNPYGQQQVYGQQSAYGATPLPLNEAIKQLPNSYLQVFTKPGKAVFETLKGRAAWNITWVQLLFIIVIQVVIGILATMILGAVASIPLSSGNSPFSMITAMSSARSIFGSFLSIITVPVVFFFWSGFQYLLAKLFQGEGSFLTQCYTLLLIQVPTAIILAVIGVIPFLGPLAGLALWIYGGIVLNIFQVQATHRLSGGKAAAVVLIPIGAIALVGICIATFLGALLLALYHQMQGGGTTP